MANNNLSGTISPTLGDLNAISEFHLSGNQFTGTIPTSLAGLESLSSLLLNDNRLSGQIPAELARLFMLTTLDLSGNLFTGRIPEGFGTFFEIAITECQLQQFDWTLATFLREPRGDTRNLGPVEDQYFWWVGRRLLQ